MLHSGADILGRIDALRQRLGVLLSLRGLVALPHDNDISNRQWSVIESGLAWSHARLMDRLKETSRAYLPYADSEPRRLNTALGEIELDLARALVFFDTYMDILTQRQAP